MFIRLFAFLVCGSSCLILVEAQNPTLSSASTFKVAIQGSHSTEMADTTSQLTTFVNGRKFVLDEKEIDPKCTLLQFLRKIGLTGAKLGCGEGGCGACTVMLSNYDSVKGSPVHYSANACLTPLCALDGIAVTTVEGIGSMKEGLHPVQQRISAMHGSQCGFCTPGIVMAIYTFLRANPNATPHEIESSLDGNLCRCTGYRPILDAARSLSNNKEGNAVPAGCCKGKGGSGGCPCAEVLKADETAMETYLHSSSESVIQSMESLKDTLFAKSRSEPIFPPALTHYKHQSLAFKSHGAAWYQPVTLDSLLALKTAHPNARLIVGNTEVGIEMRLKAMEYDTFVNPSHVAELRVLESDDRGIVVGAAVTINSLRTFIENVEQDSARASKTYRARGLTATKHMLTWFASNHIRNVACVGGNIVTASPISDLNPMLLASNAILRIQSKSRGLRELPIREFFLAYRKVALQPDEILVNVFVPYTEEFEYVLPFKQARRREDDVSIVTAGMRVALAPKADGSSWIVRDCTMSFGGMAPTAIQANATAAALTGQDWSYASVENTFATMRKELSLPVNVPGGQSEFRMALAVSFLYKAFLTMTAEHGAYVAQLNDESLPAVPSINPNDLSATFNFLTHEKTYSRGEQSHFDRQGLKLHNPYNNQNKAEFPPAASDEVTPEGGVGQSLMHRNAAAQVTGNTKYVDDMPLPANAVHACLVTSTRAHARLVSVDTSEVEKSSGFVAYLCAKDVVGSNMMGAIFHDEEIFVTEECLYYGAVIGVVLANSHEEAVLAARRAKVQYEDLPNIISIDDAIAANSFFPARHVLQSGSMTKETSEAEIHVSGIGRMGGQEHFYLETNCTIALPTENGHMEIYSSTQNIAETQKYCSSVCGLPASKVVVKCKRMGGGFGGKESRSVFIAVTAAISAHVLDRPVSINIERDVDMSITGQRHAFQYNYKAGMNKDGSLKYLEVDLYSNAGFSHDLSVPVMDRALFHVDNVYRWPALTARGNVCRTNQPTHTAFRGFGGPQGMVITETVMQHLAEVSGLDLDTLKRQNMYREGDTTHFGQPLEHFYVPSLWEQAQKIADVEARKASVAEFNKNNRWRKRGLAVTPTKFGINFTAKFMNQGGALVHVYTDGSVLVAHGGTEMGQGLFTKVIQCAAQTFGISEKFIVTTESATNTVPNASPSAASLSTDLYCMAVMDACEIIKKRLESVRERNPGCDWPTLVNKAYFERVDLSAHGFYAIHTERCGFDFDKKCDTNAERGFPFNYFTMGVACTEVEIDCLTGDSQVLRADVLMDVGKSINPAIDIGQIEGAFIQGFGWSTMEELIWGDKEHTWIRPGQLFTRGPGTYKIPSFNDVPADFRVHLSDTDNRFAVHSSKAVGEPPFFMGASVLFAIKDAILSVRKERGYTGYYQLNLPATSERIRMACADDIAKLCVTDRTGANDSTAAAERFQPFASC